MMAKHRRGPWSSAEDQCLLELVRTQGASNWVRIASLIQSRSPKQCRERYHQNLKPSLNLDPITAEEGALIERMVAEMGKRWAEIARRLHGRSDNAVKNWWNGGMNRRKRRDNRRAEMGSSHHTTAPHRAQNGAVMHPIPVSQQLYENPIFNTHHYRYEQAPNPNSLPPPAQNYPSQPRHLQQPRHLAEPAIPSPTGVSFVSRTDAESGPPSLVSDTSSSSYTTSPTTAYPPQEDARFDYREPYRRPTQNGFPMNPQYEAYSNPEAPIQLNGYPPKEYFHSQSSYPLPTEAWRERHAQPSEDHSKAEQQQRPLPSFNAITTTKSKITEPSSPPKDDRMKVNALIH